VLLLGVALGACGGRTDATPGPSVTGSPASQSAGASPTVTTSPASPSVVVDLTLLDHLPATVDGLSVEADAETSASIAASPSLASDASAIAIARVVATESDDLALASIVRLRSGPFTEASFLVWRTTYDQAACEPAGGLAATEQQQIGGREVFVGVCNGGAQTYHIALTDDILVSITAIGARHLGELLVAGLRE
jgi:hypothetical protein